MAGLVVGAAGDDERQLYEARIAELLPVARDALAGIPADAPGDFVHHLQGLLAFEGVPTRTSASNSSRRTPPNSPASAPGCRPWPSRADRTNRRNH
ncbi:hypothetical protein PV682_02500 [Streptomyces niveiscabiei]|uniref:hypothetical protein n=1 Tax=Streptomyces niveiscabiei TaxID=164115 RepID=UPI0029BEA4CC|nr:hypothetical protein [Streptomyces niveiscabiei]MDX3380315.1 hypothetical protein [Streptomyces niveiscabiei]